MLDRSRLRLDPLGGVFHCGLLLRNHKNKKNNDNCTNDGVEFGRGRATC